MKQVVRCGFSEIVVEEVPDPMLAPHHVLVRPFYSLISSGTETASIHRDGVLREVADHPSHLVKVWEVIKATNPRLTFDELRARFHEYAVLGYSGAGVVVERHPTVTDLHIGARVAYGGEGTGHGETILAARNLVVEIPGEVSFEPACFATLGSIAMNAVRTAEIGLGDRVAIIGLGLVGQLVAQLALRAGAMVIGLDLKPSRIELARKLGMEVTVPAGASPREAVLAATGGVGADCAIVAAAADSAVPVQLALSLCRDRGRILVVGAVSIELPWQEMYRKDIRLLMSRAYGPGSYDPRYEQQGQDYPLPYVRWTENRNMAEFLRLCACGAVQLEPLITHRFPLAQAPKAYEAIMAPGSGSLAVLLRYPAADAPDPVTSFRPNRVVEVGSHANHPGALRVALIGAGNIAKWAHLPSLRKTGAVLRAVHSANGARGKSYARRFGADYCTSDYSEVLADREVDAVLITSRNVRHAGEALSALRAGKHVFVEKPMALTIEECRELTAAVRDTGLQLFIGFNRRFTPDYTALKRIVERRSGPVVVNARIDSPGVSGDYWMADPSSGGPILGEACHFADLFYWLLESEPREVAAYCLPPSVRHSENNLVASLRFEDGSIANLTYATVGSRTSAGERVEVFGAGFGVITEDFKRLSVRGATRRERSRWFAAKGYNEQMAAFVAAVHNGGQPAVSVRDGARATIVCLRMLESARLGQPCSVNLDELID
jgi:predicted dehydrogenase